MGEQVLLARPDPAPVFWAALGSYTASCTLGALVAAGVVNTAGWRWVHHGLYVVTAGSVGAAASSLLWAEPGKRRSGWLLVPAGVPLALIPYLGTRGRRHRWVALSGAPFVVAAALSAAGQRRRLRGAA